MYSKLVRRNCFRFPVLHRILQSAQYSISSDTPQEHIIKSHLPDIEIPNISVPEFIFENWSKYPNRIALECVITGKKYTFEEVRKKSFALSASLQKRLKLKKGDVIGVLLPNTPDYAVSVMGALLANLTVTTLTPLYTVEEIARHLKETEVKTIVTFAPFVPLIQQLDGRLPIIVVKTNLADSIPSGVVQFNELIENVKTSEEFVLNADDVAFMMCSSGTTGLPKAVQLTHKNMVVNVSQFSQHPYPDIIGCTENYQAVVPGVLPFFHVSGLAATLLLCMRHMSKIVTAPKFQPDIVIKVLENYKPNFLIVVPYVVTFLANHPGIKQKHLEAIRVIASSAGALSPYEEERVYEKSGASVEVVQAYGMTEATALITIGGKLVTGSHTSGGSVGKPLRNTHVKIVDENGISLGPNQPGEILFKGPQLMKGYFNKPKQTQEVFADGWLKSGDVGYYDDNHNFYITERLKELIKVKGFQVAPAELEAVIKEHPKVVEAAVIGIPHSTHGEVPRAYVVLESQANADSKDIEEFVAKKVANYKQLKGGIVFVDSIPKAPSGKILRTKLKNSYLKGGS